ncbi:MAG: FAD-dependent oxidoreductase [Bacteroidales bacterium]|nr:FAD-dependent oxidoreductase [Bacteroidales bacterium]
MKTALFETIVTEIQEIAPGVFTISMPRKEDFRPGQMLALSLNKKEEPRLYSIASGNKAKEYRILFNIKSEGFLTPRLAELKVGDKLYCSHPFGSFYGGNNADWWIAAGTGIAPFISMLEAGMAESKTLIHGGRGLESFYFADRFKTILNEKYIQCSSSLNKEGIYAGRLTEYLSTLEKLPAEINYYICGSSQLVVDVRDILIQKGVPYNHIIAEIYF